ncbi:hypothetical protein [Chitinophaga parva]|nr:hypothetical protein [Chitinophaga parva]
MTPKQNVAENGLYQIIEGMSSEQRAEYDKIELPYEFRANRLQISAQFTNLLNAEQSMRLVQIVSIFQTDKSYFHLGDYETEKAFEAEFQKVLSSLPADRVEKARALNRPFYRWTFNGPFYDSEFLRDIFPSEMYYHLERYLDRFRKS